MSRAVLIVGAGALGLSSALHLLSPPASDPSDPPAPAPRSPKYSVTLLDAHPSGLAPAAASADRNKIVRLDYPDALYAGLARDALALWSGAEWEGVYHETGVLLLGDDSPTGGYTAASLENARALGCRTVPFSRASLSSSDGSAEELRACFPASAPLPALDGASGYLNRSGGWVEASRAMALLRARVERLGGQVLGGRCVTHLSRDASGQVDGVVLSSGEVLRADVVILAAGAWTAALVPELTGGRVQATGQSELFFCLDGAERGRWGGYPVVLDWGTGMSLFEPDQEGIVKVAIHHAGYVNPQAYEVDGKQYTVSVPRTARSEEGEPAVPVEVVHQLRAWVRRRFPMLGERPFVGSRMCWYTDTPDGDWVVDWCPGEKRLMFVTGGSGHAFKFLPNIGRLALQRLEGTLPVEWAAKLAFSKGGGEGGVDMSRVGEATALLCEQELAGAEELARVD
ncbi:FAD dependent oxidoreductase [Calocera cornea HHB12733]|uniref:FAD dependent oxidoreductase n=1 Tax=Calocera cornea HHB12733 TaxID=1353952 RepID=A0A165HAS3_9BASI|nr:FAD dependent oxidoreductase [Calocera cornea HHB12733]